jgi:uncharacterized membrane protein YgdD (TMEM256/DUF423 family)
MPPLPQRWIAIGAVVGAIGVGLGAFGAHGLKDYLEGLGYAGDDLTRRFDIFDTAIRYQLFHAVAIVLCGLALVQQTSAAWRFAPWAFLVGVLIFSGLLKVLTIADPDWKWLGRIVPIGGVAMILGWLALAIGAFKKS